MRVMLTQKTSQHIPCPYLTTTISRILCMSLKHTSSYNIDIPQPFQSYTNNESASHSNNQPTYTISRSHNSHTKNASSIHHTISITKHKDKHVTIPELM
jgi:hypothetical protein